MNRLFWTTLFFTVALGAVGAQSTWRGQAELWQGASVPSTASVAASNDFPKNSIVNIENYKTKKVVQVRIISGLPAGSSAFLLITSKVASDLGVGAGETPLVGVQVDTSVASAKGFASDEAINPDRDVNPVATVAAAAPKTVTPVAPVTTPKAAVQATTSATTSAPTATVTPATVASTAPATVAPAAPAPTPVPAPAVLKPQVAATIARTGATTNPLELTRSTTALDPDLVPLPALESPPVVAPPTVAVTEPEDDTAPLTPGRRVFLPVAGTDTVASEVPAVEEVPPLVEAAPVVETTPVPEPTVVAEPVVAETSPVAEPEPVVAPVVVENAPAVVEKAPAVVEKPASAVEAAPVVEPAPTVVEKPASEAGDVASVLSPSPAAATNWVSVPSGLSGPILGQVGLLTALQKCKSYVQVAAFANAADVQKALESLKTYVPVSIYQAAGEKNPWRIVIDSAPKAQMGFLMMSFRAQGYRSAAIVKG